MKYTDAQIRDIVKKLTIKEKALLCCGRDGWSTHPIERLGIPSVVMSDGPHGLRKKADGDDELGINSGIASTCFPTSATTACSWDVALMKKIGAAIGEECLQEDIQILLGPGANIKRTPLCGRNFEYFSEDPYLSSHMAAAFIDGVQSKGVGVSLKHFCANNQETNRFKVNAVVGERPLREIYLASFEHAVRSAQPATIMCSYNRLNGVQCSENKKTLTDILRGDWGFKGAVMSDWGAVDERPAALKAGLELEMPSSHGIGVKKLMKAIRLGEVSTDEINTACERMLKLIFSLHDSRMSGYKFSPEGHDSLAAQALERSAVLLKNDGVLPLDRTQSLAIIGDMADGTRIQGGGSSQVTPIKLTCILESLTANAKGETGFAKGYDSASAESDDALIAEAVELAKTKDRAVIVAGLPDKFESEGFDRTTMKIPQNQIDLIRAVAAVQPNLVVVLINGAPVELEWIDDCAALLEIYLGGQAVGRAVASLLYGDVSPSGRLAETFPVYLENCPAEITPDNCSYDEGVFVGYRFYTTRKIPTRFPFGFGLSYSSFSYSDLKLSADAIRDTDRLRVSVLVGNTGHRDAEEVVQLYVSKPDSKIKRPIRELRAFTKLEIPQTEKRTVEFELDKRAFAYYDEEAKDWRAESGEYLIEICTDSETVVLSAPVRVEDTLPAAQKKVVIDRNTTLGELRQDEVGGPLVDGMLAIALKNNMVPPEMLEPDKSDMVYQSPLRTAFSMWLPSESDAALNGLLTMLNSQSGRKMLLKMIKNGTLEKGIMKLMK